MQPLCFILMPFGIKPAVDGRTVDFDAVYESLIAPAVREAGMEPLRADHEMGGGIIHKPMFERLILCEFAVADLTTANANVFYELGLRHAVRPWATVLIFAAGMGQLPFDVAMLRGLPYQLGADGKPVAVDAGRAALAERLKTALKEREAATDSPVFQLVENFPEPNIHHIKTDVFRERARYAGDLKARLAVARKAGLDAVRAVESELGDLLQVEAGVVIDLFLSYRAVKGWDEMIALAGRMTPPLAHSAMVQEQLGLALNRAKRGEEAEKALLDLISTRGPSSETYGILGRVYKDRWEAAAKAGDDFLARGLLDKAIEAYLKGFEADWRDAYPGINAVTLMELRQPPDPRREKLLPVVSFAVERRITQGRPDYWDYATRLELAVLARNQEAALDALAAALSHVREPFEPETTARNLRLIRESREQNGDACGWEKMIEERLAKGYTSRG